MYIYDLEITLSKQPSQLALTEKREVILAAMQTFSGMRYQMNNAKYFEGEPEITDTAIYTRLCSQQELRAVGKSMRALAVELLKDEDFAKEVSARGTLLHTKVLSSRTDERGSLPLQEADAISDLTFVKSLLDYMYRRRDADSTSYKRKRAAMEEMKRIWIEVGGTETK